MDIHKKRKKIAAFTLVFALLFSTTPAYAADTSTGTTTGTSTSTTGTTTSTGTTTVVPTTTGTTPSTVTPAVVTPTTTPTVTPATTTVPSTTTTGTTTGTGTSSVTVCSQEFKPVCARVPGKTVDKTFSNECMAKKEKAKIVSQGKCKAPNPVPAATTTTPSSATSTTSTSTSTDADHENLYRIIKEDLIDVIEEVRSGHLDWIADHKEQAFADWIEEAYRSHKISLREKKDLEDLLRDVSEKFEGGGDEHHNFMRNLEREIEREIENELREEFEEREREMHEKMRHKRERMEERFRERSDPDLHDEEMGAFEMKMRECLDEEGSHMGMCERHAKEEMHHEWKKWKPEQFLEHTEDTEFFDEFDPAVFHDFAEDDFEDFDPKFFNNFIDNAPDQFKRFDPRMFEHISEDRFDEFDPRIFDNMRHFGRQIDPGVFKHVEDETFFENFDPDFFNHTDIDAIPEEVFGRIDPSKFNEMDPHLMERFKKHAPEKFNMIPKKVRRAAEMMSDDISDELLGEFGFSGDDAARVRDLMHVVNKQKREQVMDILDDFDAELRDGMLDLEEEYKDEIGSFMEYLPHVPKKQQENFFKHKKKFLEKAKKMEKHFAGLQDKIDAQVRKNLDTFLDDVETYNFVGNSAEELQGDIDEFLNEVDGLSPEEIQHGIETLLSDMGTLKDKSRHEKFSQGIIPFKDTDDNAWYTSFVSDAVENKVIDGYKDSNGNSLGEFRPGNTVTVAEAVKMAVANTGLKETDGDPAHKDGAKHWVRGWLKTAEDKGMTIPATVDLNKYASRGEVIRWVIESYGIVPPKATTSGFADVGLTDKNVDFIEYAKQMSIVSGDSDTGKFRPNDTIVRGEVAKILQKAKEVFQK